MSSDCSGLAVRQVRRDADASVLVVSGDLSLRSTGLVSGAVAQALADSGRVLVDVSGLRVTCPSAAQVFPSVLAGVGGWPGARLVLFGAEARLARLLADLRVSATVPVAPDEITAYRLLERRPRAVARYLDLLQPRSSLRRARSFLRAVCTDWQLDDIRDDAVLVASELITNAVLHAGTACRLSVRYNALGLTVAVRDHCPDRLPRRPSIAPELPSRITGLFVVAALSWEWGVSPGLYDKTVWALLLVGDSTNYARVIRKAAHDAVRATLVHGGNSPAAVTAVRQIMARLTEAHGARAVCAMAEQLALDFAEVTATIPLLSERDGQEVSATGSPVTPDPTAIDLDWWDDPPCSLR